ncbi:MAG: hypothetical protein K2N16_01770, partial [Muribaculaceae bacterium]|nr:hypothetical protein [Muribaculaceae bacterium]
TPGTPANNPFAPQPAQPKSKAWMIAPIAGGSALVFGGLGFGAYALVNQHDEPTPLPEVEPENEDDDVTDEEQQEEEEVVDVIEEDTSEVVAVSFDPSAVHQSFAVNDNMSFAEAFEAAREDVGAGGVFVWHGNIFGTYTADEWNSMSHEDQLAFSSSFHYHAPAEETLVAEQPTIDPIVTNPNEVAVVTEDEDPEIMLISQEYDPESDMTVAYITNGDDVAMLADVDNDGTYDYLVSDFDDNGEISDDEIVDISDSNLTQAQVGNLPGYENNDPYDYAME